MVEEETAKRIEELVKKRVEEELEKRKEEKQVNATKSKLLRRTLHIPRSTFYLYTSSVQEKSAMYY